MTNLNLYNQYNNPLLQAGINTTPAFAQQNSPNSQYSPNMQGMPGSMQGGLDYDTLRTQAQSAAKDNAVAQATKDFDMMAHPVIAAKNLLLSSALAMGTTGALHKLMSSKEIAEGATQLEDFKQGRFYKMGAKFDNTALGKGLQRAVDGTKGFFSKIPMPKFLREVGSSIQTGSIAVGDKSGMFYKGKGSEAINYAVENLSKVEESSLKSLLNNTKNLTTAERNKVFDILAKVKAEKIHSTIAFKELDPIVSKLNAKELSKLVVPEGKFWGKIFGFLNKVPGMRPDVHLDWCKARYFNGAYNATQTQATKVGQKTLSFIGEATGNGVLGGKMALMMGMLFMISSFNCASKAEKGDKLAAFMEDYIGLMLGSYIMSFIVGTWFNKFVGVAELGLDKKAIETLGKRMGIDMTEKRLQNVVMAYNKEYKSMRAVNQFAEQLKTGNLTLEKARANALKLGIDGAENCASFKELMNKTASKIGVKDEKYFELLRNDIKSAYKSKITLKSVGKATEANAGGFMTRLGRYVVQKPLSWLGKTLAIGRYDLVHGKKSSLKTIAKASKRWGFGLGRALLVGVVLVEPFRKGFMKISHKIFGKPKNSQLDEEEREKAEAKAAEEKEKLAAMIPPQMNAQGQISGQPQTQMPQQINGGNTNLLQNTLNKPKTLHPAMASAILATNTGSNNLNASQPIASASIAAPQDVNNISETPIAASKVAPEQNLNNAPEVKRSYVPSPVPSKFAQQKSKAEIDAERMLAQADKAEKAAQAFLAKGV